MESEGGVTLNELRKIYPNASISCIRLNVGLESSGPDSVLERPARNEPLETDKGKKAATRRFHIRFTSVRKRLCDPDNLSPKWLLDCLRYCHLIDGDEPEKITLQVGQRKAIKGEEEHTIIEITQIQ